MARLIPSSSASSKTQSPSAYTAAKLGLNGLARILKSQRIDRLVISGGARMGKSTLARSLLRDGVRLHHGEELVGLDWSAGSQRASEWLDEPGPWICENVAMARALRKWLARNPISGKPADVIVNLKHPVEPRTPGQEAMANGSETVFRPLVAELLRRGVKIIEGRL